MTTAEPRVPITELEPSARLLMACYAFGEEGAPFRAVMQEDVQTVFNIHPDESEVFSQASGAEIIEKMLEGKNGTLNFALLAIAKVADTKTAYELADSIPEYIEKGCKSTGIFLDLLCTEAMKNVVIEEV